MVQESSTYQKFQIMNYNPSEFKRRTHLIVHPFSKIIPFFLSEQRNKKILKESFHHLNNLLDENYFVYLKNLNCFIKSEYFDRTIVLNNSLGINENIINKVFKYRSKKSEQKLIDRVIASEFATQLLYAIIFNDNVNEFYSTMTDDPSLIFKTTNKGEVNFGFHIFNIGYDISYFDRKKHLIEYLVSLKEIFENVNSELRNVNGIKLKKIKLESLLKLIDGSLTVSGEKFSNYGNLDNTFGCVNNVLETCQMLNKKYLIGPTTNY